MTRERQALICSILEGLQLGFNPNFDDTNRPRFQIMDRKLPHNVFFNIPKNEKFVFQLMFENGNSDRELRDRMAAQLSAPTGGGEGRGGYLTIYLPDRIHITITESNRALIRTMITDQMRRVQTILNQ